MTYANGLREAQHTLFLLNSCFSGLAHETGQGPRAFNTSESVGDLLRARAFHLLTAGAANEVVLGSRTWGGSLFFATVLEALEMGDRDNNSVISFSEWRADVKPAVINELWPEAASPER